MYISLEKIMNEIHIMRVKIITIDGIDTMLHKMNHPTNLNGYNTRKTNSSRAYTSNIVLFYFVLDSFKKYWRAIFLIYI